MNTITFLLKFWHLNYLAILIMTGIFIFHYISNGNRLTRKSQRIFIALILFGLVTVSPLDYLSKSFLFSAHMIQHIVLLLIIPPLILTGTDSLFLEKISRNRFLRKAGDFLFYPVVAWLLGVGSMWIMHFPGFVGIMNKSSLLMDLQMIILPVLGWFFIWPVYSPVSWRKLEPLQSSLYLFLACVGCTVLGILITFSPLTMFMTGMQPANIDVSNMILSSWGISENTDHMLGGLIMWVPACIIYLTNIMIILFRWLTIRTSGEYYDRTLE